MIYSVVIAAFIYPLSCHWTWVGGWLAEMGFHDFAGSAIFHSLGGWMALMCAWAVGPRLGKYKGGKARPILGHNLTLATLGVFILWMGWFGFNPGAQLAASSAEDALAISNVFMSTNIAAAAGALSSFFLAWVLYGKPSLSLTLNGVLAGLVGITAGCDLVSPTGAAIIGIVCGAAMVGGVRLFDDIIKIDDPVGAISVHGLCGTLGTILVGLFALDGGLFYGGGATMLGVQTLGAVSYMAWGLLAGGALFFGIKFTAGLRVEKRVEEEGLDFYEHGETSYN